MPVGLHQQQRLAVGQPDLGVVFHAAEGGAVEKFQSAGNDLGGDDVGHRLSRGIHRVEGGYQGLFGRRLRNQSQEDPGNYP